MSVPPPPGYGSLAPYLIAPEAEAIRRFAMDVFGARETKPAQRSGTGRLVNTVMAIGDSTVMLACPQDGTMRQTAMLHVYVDDCDAVHARALKAGATATVEPADQFYGDRAAAVTDMGGNVWWIATRVEDIDDAEMQRRTLEAKPT